MIAASKPTSTRPLPTLINTDLHEEIDARLAAMTPRPTSTPTLLERLMKFLDKI